TTPVGISSTNSVSLVVLPAGTVSSMVPAPYSWTPSPSPKVQVKSTLNVVSCCGALSVTFLIWNDPTSRTLVTLTVTPGTPSVSGTMVAGLLVISPKSQPSVGVGSVTVHTDPVGKPPIVVDADRSSVTPMARSYDETTPSSVQLTWR